MPDLRSTVTPGQLPTCCRAPVNALNSVVLPQFGLPTKPIVGLSFIRLAFSVQPFDPQNGGLALTQANGRAADPNLDRIAQRRQPGYDQFSSRRQPHRQQALPIVALPRLEANDPATLADSKVGQAQVHAG
ncbi:hypothetical protein DF3PB_190024 [uncultured Defluviicoccus sp.]|uniref:Uncharacterized protein n=1 Tax=metagenome TaxID=256318 RepID=A0A380TCU3_9ZZZZ|nr:hypothetical protein DF3PB_190024 [uncultured Defluviicoccus sp.]